MSQLSNLDSENTAVMLSSAWFRMIDKAIRSKGIDPSEWSDISDHYQTSLQSQTIPINVLRLFLYRAYEECGGYEIFFRAADFFDPMDFGAAGVALCSAPDVKSFLSLFSEIYLCFGSPLRVAYESSADGVELWLIHNEVKSMQNVLTYLGLTLYCAVLVRFIRYVTGEPALPLHFSMPGWLLPHEVIDEISAKYHCHIKVEGEIRRLRVHRSLLSKPLVRANADLFDASKHLAYAQAEKINQSSTTVRVISKLYELEANDITVERVASELHISARTLNRKLSNENANFRSVVERFKLERALALLQPKQSNVTQIAFELGFSDLSSFSRAFKKWSGMSPKQYKENGQ